MSTGDFDPYKARPAAPRAPQPASFTPARKPEDDPALRMLVPIGCSPLAIAAGYAGLFSLVILPAPLALLLGLLAISDLKRHPEKHGIGRAYFGLIAGGIGTLILIVGVLLAIAG